MISIMTPFSSSLGIPFVTLLGMTNPPMFDPNQFEEIEHIMESIGSFCFSSTHQGIVKRTTNKRKTKEPLSQPETS